MGMASHFKTIAYTDASPVFSRSLRRRDAWTNGDMHALRRLPHQLFEGVVRELFGFDHRVGHFWPLSIMGVVPKLPCPQ